MFWTSTVCIILNDSSNTKERLFLKSQAMFGDNFTYFFIYTDTHLKRHKSPYFRLKTITFTSSGNHFQTTAQPKEISRLQAGASTTLTDGTLLSYDCASGSFYDCHPLSLQRVKHDSSRTASFYISIVLAMNTPMTDFAPSSSIFRFI